MHGVAWSIGGTAGEGLESAGEIFATALASMGYAPSTGRDFPSRIRGGDTTFTVRLTPDGFLVPAARVDVALAFNASVVPRMDLLLDDDSLLLLDEGVDAEASGSVVSFPFTRLAEEAGNKRAKNMVALGASAALLGIDVDGVADFVDARFASKGDEVVAVNRRALMAGFDAAQDLPTRQAPKGPAGEALFLSGNQAACLGALAAGCKVAAGYPITPASDILEYLTPRLAEVGGLALQVEDEMAALNAVIGAGFSGARALTATSGPGLSLMTETIGLAGSTETPCVIIDCQRPGPSTGMPTKHGQEDLWHMVHGGHGEFVRAVLSPVDVADAAVVTAEAFRLAHRWSCPTFVALDQQCSLMKQTVPPLDLAAMAADDPGPGSDDAGIDAWLGTYERYGGDGTEPTRSARPGEPGGLHYANSTEHGPVGFTNEHPGVRTAMVDRRLARMEAIIADAKDPIIVEGPEDADVIVSWGSTVGACREAAVRSEKPVRVVAIRLLWPFPTEAVRAAIGDSRVIVAEANAFGQLSRLLRSELPVHDRLTEVLRYDGNPVRSDDILEVL